MAGDRSLAFVVIGLIGMTSLWVSNHRRMGPAPSRAPERVSSAARNSAPDLAMETSGERVRGFSFGVERRAGEAETLSLIRLRPELTGWAAQAGPSLRQGLRLIEEAVLTPPVD